MSYYDDCGDEYSSDDDDIFYHNYSVDYANQILNGHHAVSSCLPRTHQKQRRYSPRLVRVSTLDQIPIVNRSEILPSLHSRPKLNYDEDISSVPIAPSRLPSLEATSEELERRATQRNQTIPQETSANISPITNNTPTATYNDNNNNNPSSENVHRPLNEAELRQVQQQQEAFQQHLLNMQRHLLEQSQQEQVPTSNSSGRRTKVSYHDLELDDDQARIADLIEHDPYVAAAMEDFAYTHGLLDCNKQRTDSNYSSSQNSQHISKRHRSQYDDEDRSHRSSSSLSSSVSISSLNNVTSKLKDSNVEIILLRELKGIRRLMEEFVHSTNNMNNLRGMSVHYPTVEPVTDYRPSMVPRKQNPPPEPNQILYQNVVDTIREVMDRRSPSQREQQLKPSEINAKYKYTSKRKPPNPLSTHQSTVMERSILPTQNQRQRNSLQMTTPPIVPSSAASSSNVPPAPPYEALVNFSSSRSTTIKDRNLSYGSRQRQANVYDRLFPGNYLRLYTNKYN
ncbi:unnamed protein product [Rotaria magnacalcarata]|uniref:Uncharacterized protein n=1 Tax=Rotaria magnacalcarata TaxID=392030 RepID=A0A816A917_9BILA|nr:unnamed protein product [Rotaria magnacalcarata]CAF1605073.1 unnamed protein product [Rotaria magnacalcarata]CAF2041814.1 unnamed protein product [Rotaria magnacalcarata]CAF3829787.1 unnamed protein product [Rotaria magnacalcarata]CAF3850450.1 unnamed protein product [Rotaria magnacalcarata]